MGAVHVRDAKHRPVQGDQTLALKLNEMFENYRVPKVAQVAKVARAAGGEPTTTTPKTLDDEMFEN